MSWMTSFNPKRHQRAMNKAVRRINKHLGNDDLWFGRFMIRQVESPQFIYYEDKSGAELYVTLEFVDRCTGYCHRYADTVNHWCWGEGATLYHLMNEFIVQVCKVWDEPLAHERNYDAWREYNKTVRKV